MLYKMYACKCSIICKKSRFIGPHLKIIRQCKEQIYHNSIKLYICGKCFCIHYTIYIILLVTSQVKFVYKCILKNCTRLYAIKGLFKTHTQTNDHKWPPSPYTIKFPDVQRTITLTIHIHSHVPLSNIILAIQHTYAVLS